MTSVVVDRAALLASLRDTAPSLLCGFATIDSALLARAPSAAAAPLSRFAGGTIMVFALPIVDQALWLWHHWNDARYLFANHVLERAADRVGALLTTAGVRHDDVARRHAGAVSLVELGVAAGLGTRGINNLLLHPRHGAWLQLHALAFDERLAPDAMLETDVCTRCGYCVRACPAKAIRGHDFFPARCAILVANPALPRSRAVAVTASSYIECAECIAACPIGDAPEGLFAWQR